MPLKSIGPAQHFKLSTGYTAKLKGRDVFVKEPNSSDESISQFANELYLVSQAKEIPGLLQPIEFRDNQLIFPFIEHDLLTTPLKLDVKTQVLTPLLETLSGLERNKIAHRDLKLENVRVDEAGKIFLADFGRATRYDDYAANRLGAVSQHHAPDTTVSGLLDIYALGVIAYQLLVGPHFMRDFVFRGRDSSLLANLPKLLSDFIVRATEPSALKRFQSASEALAFLTAEPSIESPVVEPYDLQSCFEIYIECLKSTFESSALEPGAFDTFVGDHGAKYYARLGDWSERKDALLVHLKIEGRVAGILEASVNRSGQAQISTLFIEKKYRGRGYAVLLEKAALEFFKGHSHLTLNVSKTNQRAIGFYRKSGWVEAEPSAYPDSLQFTKKI